MACLLWSCGKKKADDPMGDNGRTQRTENLLYHLKEISSKGYLFGQQDATLMVKDGLTTVLVLTSKPSVEICLPW